MIMIPLVASQIITDSLRSQKGNIILACYLFGKLGWVYKDYMFLTGDKTFRITLIVGMSSYPTSSFRLDNLAS